MLKLSIIYTFILFYGFGIGILSNETDNTVKSFAIFLIYYLLGVAIIWTYIN